MNRVLEIVGLTTIFAIVVNTVRTGFPLTSFDHQLFLDYVKTIFSWPFVIFILGIISILKFSSSIRIFLESIRLSKAGPFEFLEKQSPFPVKEADKQIDSVSKTDKEKIENLLVRAEFFEFSYFNLFFVYNTKQALIWFYGNSQSTKDNFVESFALPQQVINQKAEKETIFNILLANALLEQNGILFFTSEKGKRFLQYLGYQI